MSEFAIQVKHLNKMYKLYNKPSDRLKEALGFHVPVREHYALRDVSFNVKRGETVGIIGTNGSGKSTILKIITGVLNPTGGEVVVDGRISALLELGAGFNMEYTGIENVYLNGTMMGFSKEEIDARLQDILDFADQVRMEDVQPILDRQIKLNSAIAQEGLDNNYGAQIGKTLMHVWGKGVTTRACARAAAGSDARMGGCSLPVVINSGSGNQGMTVSLPVIVYAEEWEVSHEKLCRSLVVSNLIAIHQKYYIGSLSAYCGAVSAACGAGAGITYMYGGNYQQVSLTIINTLGNVGGIVCDGAKPSCAAKIASSVDAALMAFQLSIQNKSFLPGEGIIKGDVEETIKSMGYIGRVGMRSTDTEILNVMIDKVNVNQDC